MRFDRKLAPPVPWALPRPHPRSLSAAKWSQPSSHSHPSTFIPSPFPSCSTLRLIMWQENSGAYNAGTSQSQYYAQPPAAQPAGVPLQFYAPTPVGNTFFPGSRSSLDGNPGVQGSMNAQGGVPPGYGGNMQTGGWWTAFGTGGVEGEPPLLEGASPVHEVLAHTHALQSWESTSHIYAPNP